MHQNLVLVFPGQGSQYVGMGTRLDNKYKEIFSIADSILGHKLSSMCFEGPEEELKLTCNTQPAILSHSIALLNQLQPLLKKYNIKIQKVLGHSVGEYAALVAAEVISFEDAVKAVHYRGKFMQEAVPAGIGKMVAILKVPQEIILQACKESSTSRSMVSPANFNTPIQTVISGTADACDKAVQWLKDNYKEPFRAMPLKVSAPFHCPLMKDATRKLETTLNEISFNQNIIPYIANIDAKEYQKGTESLIIKKNLIEQVEGSVLWSQSIKQLSDDTLIVEVGPGKILAGMIKKINPNIKVISLDSESSFENLELLFKGEQ